MDSNQATAPLTQAQYRTYFEAGYTYAVYMERFQVELADGPVNQYTPYLPINWQRMQRINKTVVLHDEMLAAIAAVPRHLNWLVITENWCGDAGQLLPVMNAVTEASGGKISLRLVYRDAHLELIDHHLTNGSRSIPRLLQLDDQFNLLATWGPRPAEAQALVLQLKANPETAPHYNEHLHKWYATNKTLAAQKELAALLSVAG
ncbi:MAG: thioredoxin family protein [Chitinophagia bacterium]|nr:thioredoxin family protein [Chitinophagia bacterium]